MATNSSSSASSRSREARKRAYERVLGTVRRVPPKDDPLVSEWAVKQVCASSGSITTEAFETALRAAVEHGDVYRWHGQLLYVGPDVDEIEPHPVRAAIQAEAESEHPRGGLIGDLNQLLDELEDGGRE